MYPASFEYVAPATLEEALDTLGRYEDDAKVLAGTTWSKLAGYIGDRLSVTRRWVPSARSIADNPGQEGQIVAGRTGRAGRRTRAASITAAVTANAGG